MGLGRLINIAGTLNWPHLTQQLVRSASQESRGEEEGWHGDHETAAVNVSA